MTSNAFKANEFNIFKRNTFLHMEAFYVKDNIVHKEEKENYIYMYKDT